MERRTIDGVVAALVGLVLVAGLAATWQAWQSYRQVSSGMMGGMMTTSMMNTGPSPLWLLFGTVVFAAIIVVGYLVVRENVAGSQPTTGRVPGPGTDRAGGQTVSGADSRATRRTAGEPNTAFSPEQPDSRAGEPPADEPTGSEPLTGESTGSELSADEPTGSELSADEPTGSEPVTGEPTGSEPSTDEPNDSEPPAEESTAERTTSPPRPAILDVLPEDERRILEPIVRSPGLTQIELRDRADFSKSKVSQTVSDLEKRGLVSRERQGRTYRLYPTEDLTAES